MFKFKKQNNKLEILFPKERSRGFTLLETVVAMGIFLVVMTVTMGAFFLTIKAQRVALTEKAVAENINFATEFMSRQMRVVKRDSLGVCITPNNTYETTGSDISFLNANDECIRFFLLNSEIVYENITAGSGSISLTNGGLVAINNLNFTIRGEANSDLEQPRVTISIMAQGAGSKPEAQGVKLNIQTSVSARALDI